MYAMPPLLFLSLTSLLAALTIRAIWRNDLSAGVGAALLLPVFYIPLPAGLLPFVVVAWGWCVWPQRHT